eukprot:gene18559-25068_t
MVRQLFGRLISLARGEMYSLDILHKNHVRYRLYHTRDVLELGNSPEDLLGSDWWKHGNTSSAPEPKEEEEEEEVLLDVVMLWSPHYIDMANTVKLVSSEFNKAADGGGSPDPVVMLLGSGLWHVNQWPKEPKEKGEFNSLLGMLSKELLYNADSRRRFTRGGQQLQEEFIQDRNYGLKSWVDAAYRAPYATLIPFDKMSRSPGAPTGLLGRDWHYGCELQRWGDYFMGNNLQVNIDYMTGCLVPDENGSCQDYMNAMIWQVAANLMCNGQQSSA